jgi:hypothetical protein
MAHAHEQVQVDAELLAVQARGLDAAGEGLPPVAAVNHGGFCQAHMAGPLREELGFFEEQLGFHLGSVHTGLLDDAHTVRLVRDEALRVESEAVDTLGGLCVGDAQTLGRGVDALLASAQADTDLRTGHHDGLGQG